MTDLPLNPLRPASPAARLTQGFARLIALFQTARGVVAQATARNAERKAPRRAPEEILGAQARREAARRATDRLLQQR